MTDAEWEHLSLDEKLNYLRKMVEDRLDQANRISERLARLGFTMDARLKPYSDQIGDLTARVEALEKAVSNRPG